MVHYKFIKLHNTGLIAMDGPLLLYCERLGCYHNHFVFPFYFVIFQVLHTAQQPSITLYRLLCVCRRRTRTLATHMVKSSQNTHTYNYQLVLAAVVFLLFI